MPKMIAGPATGLVPILSVRSDLHADDDQSTLVSSQRLSRCVRSARPAATCTACSRRLSLAACPSCSLPTTTESATIPRCDCLPQPTMRLVSRSVLEAARLLAGDLPSGTGLAVALLDGEEAGARGSAHHAPQVAAGTYVINVDGAARLGEAAAVEAGGPAEPLLAALDQAGRQTGVPLRAGAMASDNRRYAAAGLPSIGIGMGMPGYQTTAETPDRVEPRTLLAADQSRRGDGQAAHQFPCTSWRNPMIVPSKDLPVAVIGAGPVGLAAAAHLAERGIDFVVLEAGSSVGRRDPGMAARARCSAPGATTSTPPPAVCSPAPAGPNPTRTRCRPAAT